MIFTDTKSGCSFRSIHIPPPFLFLFSFLVFPIQSKRNRKKKKKKKNKENKETRGDTHPVDLKIITNPIDSNDRAQINRFTALDSRLVTANFDLPFEMCWKRQKVDGSDTRAEGSSRLEFGAPANRYSPKPSFQPFEIPLRRRGRRQRNQYLNS